MEKFYKDIQKIIDRIEFQNFDFVISRKGNGYLLQVQWDAEDNFNPGEPYRSKGRKWYISPHATTSEIVFTAWAAVELCIKHEAMECFLYEGQRILNPHRNVEALAYLEWAGKWSMDATEGRGTGNK